MELSKEDIIKLKIGISLDYLIKNINPLSSLLGQDVDQHQENMLLIDKYGYKVLDQLFSKWNDDYNNGWVFIIICNRIIDIDIPVKLNGDYTGLKAFYFAWYRNYSRKKKIKNILNDKQ